MVSKISCCSSNLINFRESATFARKLNSKCLVYMETFWVQSRVSYKNRFISKEPKLEPNLVSTLSETKRLDLVDIAGFEVLVEVKLTTLNAKQL